MKMKKLLASALAAAMVVSSMVGTLVTSAATNTGSIAVESLTIEPGTATFDADITITFDAEIKSPHAILDIAAEGYTLTGVTSADTKLKIEANDGGENYAEGKVLIETDVSESVAPTYAAGSSIVLNATFAEDDTVNAEGDYAITVTATEVTSFGENDLTLDAGAGKVTVKAPHVCDMQTKYDENGHWDECECGIKTDVVPHTLGDYDPNEDGTTETAKCTGCDYTETRDSEVVCEHANATLEYAVVDGNCVTTKVCPDCEYSEAIYSAASVNVEKGLNLKEGLAVIFRVKVADISGTDVYAVINHDVYSDDNTISGTSTDMVFSNVVPSTGKTPKYGFTYTGLAAKEMLSEIHVRVYATDSNGDVILVGALDFVLADALKSSYLTKDDVKYVNLGADILRYGAESQKAFNYRPSVLPTEGVDESCFSELPTTFTNIDVTEGEANVGSLERAVVLQNTISFRFRLTTIEGISAEDLHYTVDFVNSQGAADSATGAVGYNANGKKYEFTFSTLPVAIVNDYYTVTLWNGETAISIQTFSFQNYAHTQYTTSGSRVDLAQAICAYSTSAAALFKTA